MNPGPHWVDAVIVLTLLEGLWLWQRHRRTGRGIAPRDFAWNWVSGLCLMAALRGAVAGWGMVWVLAWLSAAGLVHALDLRRRWR
jgi:hypothetical protein